MQLRLMAIALFVAVVANACDRPIGEGGVLKANALDARPLTPRQVVAIRYLRWPQSREAILSRFGEPSYRDGFADYYPLPDGGSAAIDYVGDRAQSLEIR